VIFFFEPLRSHQFWMLDYFPEGASVASEMDPPYEAFLRRHLRIAEVRPVLVPHDCTDGFGAAYWRRPRAYLDPTVQAGMSWLALLPGDVRARGTARLRADLASGAWDKRYGHLLERDSYDGGYRIAIGV
jgi:hypothetical protein